MDTESSMTASWTARRTHSSRRADRILGLVVLALTVGCVVGPSPSDEDLDHDTSEGSSGESGESSGASEDAGASEDSPWPAECADADAIPDLPYAIAWRTQSDDGSTAVRVRVQSWPATCDALESAVPASHTRVDLRLPIDLEVPTQLELVDARAIAFISADGPGSTKSNPELRFLHGPISIDAFDTERVIGTMRTEVVPFVGCFEAQLCDDGT